MIKTMKRLESIQEISESISTSPLSSKVKKKANVGLIKARVSGKFNRNCIKKKLKEGNMIKKENGSNESPLTQLANAFGGICSFETPTSTKTSREDFCLTNTQNQYINDIQCEECASPEKLPEDDESFYSEDSPKRTPGSRPISPSDDESLLSFETSPISTKFTNVGRSFDTFDPNSMDSGYHAGTDVNNKSGFQNSSDVVSQKSPVKTNSIRFFRSLSNESMGSADTDECMDLLEMEADQQETQMPSNMSFLLSGDIKAIRNTPEHGKRPLPIARRSLSMNESGIINRARSNLFISGGTPEQITTTPLRAQLSLNNKLDFKRPEPPTNFSPVQTKRYKYDTSAKYEENIPPKQENQVIKAQNTRSLFKKSISMNDASIMSALARSNSEPNLIGDFSKPFVLPLMEGRHSDLKSISCETMAKLLQGQYSHIVASFKVIDCRYPYEYEGGHIRGAQNLYMQDQIMKALMDSSTANTAKINDAPKRNILVFHCEFSSERGPKLSRFLRNNDRLRNQDAYPALQYPEIYLLHGGYKDFFAVYPELCDPIAYRPMLEPDFTDEYKHFRAKTRSWNSDGVKGTLAKSRSRLVL